MTIRMRRYRLDDEACLKQLYEAAMRDVRWYSSGVPDDDLDDVVGSYLNLGGEFLMGELDRKEDGYTDGRIVTMGALAPAEGGTATLFDGLREPAAEMTRMRVDPDYQGHGYGGRIYEALEELARESGYRGLSLDTDPDRKAVRGFYELLGFDHEWTVTLATYGDEHDLVLYRERLA